MINIVILDDEIFSMQGGDESESYDLWNSDLEDGLEEEFQLFIFDSPHKALSKLKELGHNTIIILDMKMPEIDGSEFLKIIRKKEYTLPVIAYTADELDKDTIYDLLSNEALTKQEVLSFLQKKDYFSNEEMKIDLLKNDIFSYVRKAESNLTELIATINKVIEKFKDNIPLELNEALREYLERHPDFKDIKVYSTSNGTKLSLSEIEEAMNHNTKEGIEYAKSLYKMSFDDLINGK